jgi:hypothetical protein
MNQPTHVSRSGQNMMPMGQVGGMSTGSMQQQQVQNPMYGQMKGINLIYRTALSILIIKAFPKWTWQIEAMSTFVSALFIIIEDCPIPIFHLRI